MQHPTDLYIRQSILPFIGTKGQQKIAQTHVAIVGCGALGSVSASLLCRAGIGTLTLVDHDQVEPSNLQRQLLFNEADIGQAKVTASRLALLRIRPDMQIVAIEDHLNHLNAEKILQDAQLIIDGSDNFLARLIINDVAVKHHKPWVYGGVVAGEGVFMPIAAGGKPCLSCLIRELPPIGSTPTCETAGILNTASTIIAACQTTAALQIITGQAPSPQLTSVNIWQNLHHSTAIPADIDCPCCQGRSFKFLEGSGAKASMQLCSRAVQLLPERGLIASLLEIRKRIETLAPVLGDEHLLRFTLEGEEITLFADGRAFFKGSGDMLRCRTIYTRYIGD